MPTGPDELNCSIVSRLKSYMCTMTSDHLLSQPNKNDGIRTVNQSTGPSAIYLYVLCSVTHCNWFGVSCTGSPGHWIAVILHAMNFWHIEQLYSVSSHLNNQHSKHVYVGMTVFI